MAIFFAEVIKIFLSYSDSVKMQRRKKIKSAVVSMCMLLFPFPCYSSSMGDVLNNIAKSMHVDIFMEQGIAADEVEDLPKNVAQSDIKAYLIRVLKGYSHAEVFEGDRLVKIWIYQRGTGAFVRLSHLGSDRANIGQELRHPSLKTMPLKGNTPNLSRASPALFYTRGIKRSPGGVYYRKNAFGYKKPIILPLSLRNNPQGTSRHDSYMKGGTDAHRQMTMAKQVIMSQWRQKYMAQGDKK